MRRTTTKPDEREYCHGQGRHQSFNPKVPLSPWPTISTIIKCTPVKGQKPSVGSGSSAFHRRLSAAAALMITSHSVHVVGGSEEPASLETVISYAVVDPRSGLDPSDFCRSRTIEQLADITSVVFDVAAESPDRRLPR